MTVATLALITNEWVGQTGASKIPEANSGTDPARMMLRSLASKAR
jgi:hypothetical protein